MKSINVRKIATMAAGAVLLGAALATAVSVDTAGLGNYQFLSNGSPAVKIVVGANAAASDGVAAANIAAMIGNMAYRAQDVTASKAGASTCAAGAGGACSLSAKKATILVTAPGAASSDAYSFSSLLGVSASEGTATPDFIDPTLENRAVDTIARSPYSVAGIDTMRRMDHSIASMLSEATIRDDRASKSYTNKEIMYVGGRTEFDASQDTMALKSPEFAYATEFSGDVYGIPYCTESDPDVVSNAGVACPSSSRTQNHHVAIKWMGSNWVITSMTPAGVACAAGGYGTGTQTGGSIKVAKESIYVPALTVGSNMSVGTYTVMLSDITSGVTAATLPRSAFKIYDASGVLKDEVAVDEGQTQTAPNTNLKIHVYTAVPGLFANARWAEVAVYEEEMELSDGLKINADNNDWKVEVYWTSGDVADATCDSLYGVELRGTNLATVYPNSVIKMPAVGDKYQLKVAGVDLTDAEYDTLSFEIQKNIDIAGGSAVYTDIACTAPDLTPGDASPYVNTDALKVTSTKSDAFKFTVGTTDITTDTVYIDMDTGRRFFSTNCGTLTQLVTIPAEYTPIVAGVRTLAGTATPLNAGAAWVYAGLTYQFSSSETAATIGFYTDTANAGTAASQNWFVDIVEDSKNNQFDVVEFSDSIDVFGVYASDDYVFYQSTAKTAYKNALIAAPTAALPPAAGPITDDIKLVTDRGSIVDNTGISTTKMIVKYAKTIGKMKYTISKSGAAASSDSQTLILGEGEAGTVGTTTVNVTAITATATAAAGSGCTVNDSAVSCTPSVASAAVVTPIDTSASKLVVLDSDAEAAATSAAILVGGPVVNTITAQAIAGSGLTFTSGAEPVVKVIGSKVVVAGYSAADTVSAANELIKFLVSKRA